jgi:predicted nucleic acid-binding protein
MIRDRRLVIDASVAAKWYLQDEDPSDRDCAELLLAAAGDERIFLYAPTLFVYEAIGAISRGFHRRLQAQADAASTQLSLQLAVNRLLAVPIRLIAPQDDSLRKSAEMALHFSRSSQDMTYLNLATELDWQWCTTDSKVLAPTRSEYPRERIVLVRDAAPIIPSA